MHQTELGALLDAHSGQDAKSFAPQLFRAADPGDRARLRALLDERSDLWVIDTLHGQLTSLARTESRHKNPPASDIRERVARLLDGHTPETHGYWVHYPWARKLVHLLPPRQFRRLRLDRNLHKVTEAEQRKLLSKTIAVVGLSVGRSALLDLVQEGVGGTFRISDFDALDVSNLNRLRGSTCDVGINKAVLAAREVYEQDPYMHVEVFSEGVTDESIDRILNADVDLLVEECDDLGMKVRLRECAQALKLPVVMNTSDRGMLDVERFDLEPDRPILHGLLPDVGAEQLRGLTNKERIPFALAVLDTSALSTRMAGSLAEVEETTCTWPQLASGVALGGALVCDTARRILLDTFRESGRYYVDLEALVRKGQEASLPETTPLLSTIAPAAQQERLLPSPSVTLRDDPRGVAQYLVQHAQWAPSGGNNQPWLFRAKGMTIDCYRDAGRAESFLDFDGRVHQIAIGAAVENLCIAAPSAGLHAQVTEMGDGNQLARVTLSSAPYADPELRLAIGARVTNRHVVSPASLPSEHTRRLVALTEASGLHLRFVTVRQHIDAWGQTLGEVDRMRALIRPYHDELFSAVRWSAEDVLQTLTGIDLQSLELSPSEAAGIRVLERWSVADFLRNESLGGALRSTARKAFAGCGGVALLAAPAELSFFQAGRLLQRFWLEATRLGLAMQPWAPILGMMPRAMQSAELAEEEAGAVMMQVRKALELWKVPRGHYPLFLFRVMNTAPAPSARSLRLDLAQVLHFD